jgi:tape measure domain-containing protein
MANPIVQAIYDLKDNISAKIKVINDALRGNQKETDKTADAVERNNARASASYKKTAQDIGDLRKALAAVAAFVGLDKLKDGLVQILDVGERFDDLQKEFAAAFGGLEAGTETLDKVREIAANVPQSLEDVSAAAIALKRAGFDPLDGSLQALIDNQNALGQSQEDLIATIEALGRANVKGEANIKTLTALSQQGIPVFDLLSKSLGVSADRVRELAESGQLGQDTIKRLVAELGNLRAGAAADELGDLDSQLTKLKDSGREFLDTIAKSGALDFFREQLQDLNAEVTAAANDGRLKALAKSISDGIVSTANAVRGAIGLVVEYSGALIELGKTYLVFKAIDIGASFIKAAADMEVAARKTKAAKVEAEAAATGFGKLRASIGKLPSTIKFSIAAIGIDYTLNKIIALGEGLTELRHAEVGLREAQDDLAETSAHLQDKIAGIKREFGAFADVAIESADALKNSGEEQLKSYADQLAGAQRYYRALALEAKLAGDEVGMASAKQHLADLQAEIALVNQQLAATKAVGSDAAAGLSDGAKAIAAKLGEIKDDAKATADFIQKSFEGFDFGRSVTEIGDFAAALDSVAAKGGKAAETLDSTLLESLKKLTGEQLLQFQSASAAAIDGLGEKAASTSAVLRATLETSLDRLGVKAEATGQAITKSGKDTIATFTAVAENAQATAQTIEAAFDAALASVKTVDEAKALGAAIQAAADTGKISLKELADASRDLDERLRSLTAAVSPLASQFDLLGIKSQAQLIAARDNAKEAFDAIVQGAREGTAAQEDVVRAFKAWADAARAAAADSGSTTKAQVDEQIALQASILNLTDALAKSGDVGKDAGDKTAEALRGAADAADDLAGSATAAAAGSEALAAGTAAAAESANAFAESSQTILLLTADQLKQMRALRDEVFNGTLSWQDYGEQVNAIITGVDENLQKQEEALRKFNDELNDLQSQLASAQGDDVSVENLRHEKKMQDIKDEQDLTLAQRRQLEDLEEKLHEANLKRIKDEQNAQKKGDQGGPDEPNPPNGGGNGGGSGGGSGGGGGRAAPAAAVTVNAVLLSGDQKAVDDLTRRIKKGLTDIDNRSR